MCGIAGIWRFDGNVVDRAELESFTDSLAHRGPDGRGFHLDDSGRLGLGHRRLSIIDVSERGSQPMSDNSGRYWIVFNGEIYNFLEIRAELESSGALFRTDSDTEVVLAAYAAWGEDCQLKFNGMWAFAIWDAKDRSVFLSRDRFGVKPLHYHWDGKNFAFASEMKAFLRLGWLDKSFDPAVVAYAIANNKLEATESCLLKGVNRLLGGFSLRLSSSGKLVKKRWWRTLDHLSASPKKYADKVEKYRELLFDACRVRMRSDVPIGTSLSGGMDSSAVVCAMAAIMAGSGDLSRIPKDWHNAFIASYPNTAQDETPYAEEVARHSGAKPHYCEISHDGMLENMDMILYKYEAVSDAHVGPWAVYRAQRASKVVVSIDGHGGDEALGGYGYYLPDAIRDAAAAGRFSRIFDLRRASRALYADPLAAPALPKASELLDCFLSRNLSRRKGPPGVFHRLSSCFSRRLEPPASPGVPRGGGGWLRVPSMTPVFPVMDGDEFDLEGRGLLWRSLYLDYHCFSLPLNLNDYDRLSMAHGVEVRSPFCDWRLACYTFSLPSECLIGHGFTKRILRDAMKGLMPESIRTRTQKLGFSNPRREWFFGPLKGFILDSVRSNSFEASSIWDGNMIAKDVETAFATGNFSLLHQAWRYIQADNLMRVFKAEQTKWR